jgi:type IV secretion system protein VirB9
MIKKFALLIALTSLCGAPAFAEQNPIGTKSDVRIKTFAYDENNVYNLSLYLKSVTAVQFAPDENVRSILIGDSASWEVVKLQSGNVVSIKPIIHGALTNMTVYTDQRVYTFQLRSVGAISAGPKGSAAQAFRTTFTYPEKKDASDSEQTNIPTGPINTSYMVSGAAQFRPISVADNSLQTVFELPLGAPRPAVFRVGSDNKERLANSRTEGNRMIVSGTSDYWVLRIGDEIVCIGKSGAVLDTSHFKATKKPKKFQKTRRALQQQKGTRP